MNIVCQFEVKQSQDVILLQHWVLTSIIIHTLMSDISHSLLSVKDCVKWKMIFNIKNFWHLFHKVNVRTSQQYSLIGKDNYRIPDQCKWRPQRISAFLHRNVKWNVRETDSTQTSKTEILKALSPSPSYLRVSVPGSRPQDSDTSDSDLRRQTEPEPTWSVLWGAAPRLRSQGSIIVNMQQIQSPGFVSCRTWEIIASETTWKRALCDKSVVRWTHKKISCSLNGRLIIFIKDDITKTDASATFSSLGAPAPLIPWQAWQLSSPVTQLCSTST